MKKIIFRLFCLPGVVCNYLMGFILMSFCFHPLMSRAQADSSAAVTPAENTYSPIIEFTSTQKSDNSVDLKANVSAKVAGTLIKLSNLKIEYFLEQDATVNKLGEALTDKRGIALFNCKADQLLTDKEGKLNFKAAFPGKDSFEAAEEVLVVKRARLEMTPVKADSLLMVKLKLVDLTTGTAAPIPETDLGVYVKRMFSALKIGEGKTDENGEAEVEIPLNLTGDDKGNITLLARLEENEDYGNLEAATQEPWGKPVSYELKELPRALWSTHPPVWMMVTFAVLMTAVWGHYLVIIIQLFRLRKEEAEAEPDSPAL